MAKPKKPELLKTKILGVPVSPAMLEDMQRMAERMGIGSPPEYLRYLHLRQLEKTPLSGDHL